MKIIVKTQQVLNIDATQHWDLTSVDGVIYIIRFLLTPQASLDVSFSITGNDSLQNIEQLIGAPQAFIGTHTIKANSGNYQQVYQGNLAGNTIRITNTSTPPQKLTIFISHT